jgi:isopenicillin-N epimerase
MKVHHWEEVRVSCHHLLRNAIERICDLTGLPPLYPLDSNYYHQMGTVPIPKVRDLNELKSRLYNDYKIEIPCIDWNDRHFLRLSVQGYNSEGDIDVFVNALSDLLPMLTV